MPELAETLLQTIRRQELVRAGDRVAVAVSGGADSVALLLLLVELRSDLGIVLSVAHVNHKLRGAESDEDERFVEKMAAGLGLECLVRTAVVDRKPATGIESATRKLRYEFFQELARDGCATKIATAHTLDDQAETVLLRMFRGTGIRGLAGIHPRLRLEKEGHPCGEVVRPLLGFRRAELRMYLQARGQAWRDDSSNQDVAFLRNRVRQRLLPVIAEEFGEASIEHLAELAEIARAEEESASSQYPVPVTQWAGTSGTSLDVERLLTLPLAAARRVVRVWIEATAPEAAISFRLIEDILELARGAAGKKLELPGGSGGPDVRRKNKEGVSRPERGGNVPARHTVRRGRKELMLETGAGELGDYEYELLLPGEVAVPELGARIEARIVEMGSVPVSEKDGLLHPERVGDKVVIRNWRAGDRYWPAHTSAEKKVKDLLGDRHVTGAAKKLWPVAVAAGELVWMRGFATPAAWRPDSTAGKGKVIWIRETAGLM